MDGYDYYNGRNIASTGTLVLVLIRRRPIGSGHSLFHDRRGMMVHLSSKVRAGAKDVGENQALEI
jgi:hypothetical protein